MSQRKMSMAPPPNSNLYCTSCDSQIGVFDNEWTHLTTSYARPQEKGIHFGTEIGVKTQIVPVGSAQKNAEGCEMSEVYCTKCSTVVAQYCRTAPEPSKQHFVSQYFYKVSRVYLKDSHNSSNIEMKFIGEDAEQSQRVLKSASADTTQRQRLPPARAASDVPFRQSFPPPSGQSWLWPPPQGHSSQPTVPTDFRSASAQPVLDFRHDQLAPLAECASRITATDMRLANQEMRFNTSQEKFHNLEVRVDKYTERLDDLETDINSIESKLTNLNDKCELLKAYADEHDSEIENQREKVVSLNEDYTQLESYFHDQDAVVKEQQVKIEEQDQELRRVTAKLEGLQSVIDDLKTKVNENKAQHLSVSRTSNHLLPQDFFENLEIMVKAMKSTQSDSDELRALRDENRAMKTRLRTIAGAMGFALEKDADLPNEKNIVLGKRKRAAGYDTVQQQKSPRHSNGSAIDFTQSALALPTPDSSQNKAPFLQDTRKKDMNDTERSMDDAEEDADFAKTVEVLDESVVEIADDDEMMEQAEHRGSVRADTLVVSNVQSSVAGTHEPVTRAHKTPATVPSDQTRTTSTQQAARPSVNAEHNLRLIPICNEPASSDGAIQSAKTTSVAATILQQRPSRTARASFTSNRPVSMMDRMRSPSVRNSPAPLPFSAPLALPPSQINMINDGLVNSRQGRSSKSSLRKPETFSGALSRGETLENVVQRRQSSHNTDTERTPQQGIAPMKQQHHSRHESTEAPNQVLQPCQNSRLNTCTAGVLSSNVVESNNALPVAESVEFSDEENEPSGNQKGNHQGTASKTASKTPIGEPKVGSTLISRTIPGLTFEPLVRPVIEDENNDNSRAGSRRQSVSAVNIPGAPSIMPEILAAIKNLNDCAVLRPAKPGFSTPGPRSSRTKAPVKKPKKVRKSEPISKSFAENLAHSDHPEPFTTITRSKSSANDSADQISSPAIVPTISDTDNAPNLPSESSEPACRTVKNGNDSVLPSQDEVVDNAENSRAKMPQEQVPKKVNSMRKSLSRQQLLMERNRLAMEAMEREEAGQRFSKVAV